MNFPKQILSPALLVFLATVGIVTLIGCAEAPEEPSAVADPLQLIPADALFCVRIHDVEQTLTQLDQYLLGVTPLSPGMLLKMQLGQAFGNPQLTGLRLDGDLFLFGRALSDRPEDFSLGILVPITDFKTLIDSCQQGLTERDQDVVTLHADSLPLYMTSLANYALLCPEKQQLKQLHKQALSQLDAGAALSSFAKTIDSAQAPAPVWIYSDIQQAGRQYGALLQTKLAEAKTGLERTMQQPNTMGQSNLANSKHGLDMIAQLLPVLFEQLTTLTITLNPQSHALILSPSIKAVPESTIGRALAGSDYRNEQSQLGLLDAETIMSYCGNTRLSVSDTWWTLLETWFGKSLSPRQAQALRDIIQRAGQVFTGTSVMSMRGVPDGKPWFSLRYALPITDQTAYDRFMQEVVQLLKESGINEWYQEQFGFGITFNLEKDKSTYQGVAIDHARARFVPADPNAPEMAMLETMYGDGFDYRLAVVDNFLLLSTGPDVDTTIHQMIDRSQGRVDMATTSEFTAALNMIPQAEEADFVATYNYLRIMKAVTKAIPVPMPDIDIQTRNNLVLAGRAADHTGTLDIVVPKDHLMEIAQYFMTLQMQMQQQRQEQQRQQQQGQEASSSGRK